MGDEKQPEPVSQAEQNTEFIKEEQKDNGESGKTDKVKGEKKPTKATLYYNKYYALFCIQGYVDILLKATGNAPIMKKKKWAVDAEKPIGWIMEFVKKYLKLEPDEKLFLYVNQTFAPSPDQVIRNLYECFSTDGKLVLHYCKSQAWG